MELVIMAAGMGSRFGGLKQIEPVDEFGNFIIDYSIFDAIRCGFDKVVIIVKKENLEAFRTTIGKRIESKIKTEYVFQDTSNIPEKYLVPTTRTKPFGTGHAVLSAKSAVESNFAVINADDFYGYDAFLKLAEFLKFNQTENHYAIVGYEAINTMGRSGSVKRGICSCENGELKNITESSITLKENGKLEATAIDGSDATPFEISSGTPVSMNMFAFTPKFMEELEIGWHEFLESNKNNLESCEFFLPTMVSNLIKQNKASAKVLETSSKWLGITYKEDKDEVVSELKTLRKTGVYPMNLWNN